jgi:hypothetical protein
MRPSQALVDTIAPPHPIAGLRVLDTRGVYRIKQADFKDAMRISRTGPDQAQLVATKRHFDGAGDPERSGYYANVFIVFRSGKAFYRTQGVRVLPAEATRIARALKRGTSSRPSRNEEPRLAGTGSGTVTELRAEPFGDSVLLYVRFRHGSRQELVRSRGVEVRGLERYVVAEGLLKMAKRGSRA